ncbi:MAG: 4-hydroxy-3-methylbut-2-enyl diphosphate reductase [Micavibrio sp.]|nr:MAG: 4-hydroxy-3-methylbut-2-enyl diphosphate reductase [Micavibrio sp.]
MVRKYQDKSLTILLADPRGFCAGVDRAILIVEKALEKYGAPVYVRHEIVHNRHVLDDLEKKGAVFVETLDEVPDDVPVIFSAHGVPKRVPEAAEKRGMFYIDATCPLVSKVHRETERHHKNGLHVLLIGHAGHPEVEGTTGQLPDGAVTLIETAEDAENYRTDAPEKLAYATQTTLSVDDTQGIVDILLRRFPEIAAPKKEDICYATTNRQNAVKAIAPRCDLLIVIGSANSSNANRLVETAQKNGCTHAFLAQNADAIDWEALAQNTKILGLSAGASTPEKLVQGVIDRAESLFGTITIENITTAEENITFKLPRILAA